MNRFAAALLLVSLALPARADEEEHHKFKVIHVADLAAALKSANPPSIYDANNKGTREDAGTVPGAHLLASYYKYDVAKELPADKSTPLVFYCANKMCMASHTAAERAVDAGYKDVSVMVDGIFGWKDAHQPCAPVSAKPKTISPKAAAALVEDKGAVIVDVREGEERYHVIPGAQWMPMSKVKQDKEWTTFAQGLLKNKTIVFHCVGGTRAHLAAEKISKEGFNTAYFEGTDQWKDAGLPLDKGPAK